MKFLCHLGLHDWGIAMGFDQTATKILGYNYHWKCRRCGCREHMVEKNMHRLDTWKPRGKKW